MMSIVSTRKFFAVVALAMVIIPGAAFAATSTSGMPAIWPTGYWGPLISCTGDGSGGFNPCISLCDLVQTILNVLSFGITIAVFVFAPALFIVGAIMVMLAGANPGLLEKGKKTLTGTLIGLVIILASYLIISAFVYFVGIAGVGGFTTGACSILAAPP